jgi:hypothetical protein
LVEEAVAAEDEDVEVEEDASEVVAASSVGVGAGFSDSEIVASKRASVAKAVAARKGRRVRRRILKVDLGIY